MRKEKLEKLKIAASTLTVFFGISTFAPLLVMAQINEQSAIGEQVTPITFNFDLTPANFNFTPIHISAPSEILNSYYINPQPNDNTTALVAHDGRYNGGFKVTVQVDDFVKTGSPGTTISASELAIVTISSADEVRKNTTTPAVFSMDGDPSSISTDYDNPGHQFTSLGGIDIISAPAACSTEGRVGTYTTYPSFRLHVPTNTQAGTYTSTLTYTITAEPTSC
jgi:hypothetical protein